MPSSLDKRSRQLRRITSRQNHVAPEAPLKWFLRGAVVLVQGYTGELFDRLMHVAKGACLASGCNFGHARSAAGQHAQRYHDAIITAGRIVIHVRAVCFDLSDDVFLQQLC